MERLFRDRKDAGQKLAKALEKYKKIPGLLVLGLPRGGVVVAYEVAKELDALLDVFVVRKLGVPGHEELAMGAISSGGARVLNREVIESLRISQSAIDEVAAEENKELERRERLYRGPRLMTVVEGRHVIVIDDGLATGATMQAVVVALREQKPSRLIVAVPVAAQDTCAAFQDQVDETICLYTPETFFSVGSWYEEFGQTTDEEVQDLLRRAEGDKQIDGVFFEGEAAKRELRRRNRRAA